MLLRLRWPPRLRPHLRGGTSKTTTTVGKEKGEEEVGGGGGGGETAFNATRTARTTPASAISRRQRVFNNQHGREEAAEGSGVGADGSTMYHDAMMVAANNDRERGGRRPSRRRWRLEVVLPSPPLSTSRDDGS